MSDILVTYKQNNKADKYYLMTSAEQKSVDSVVTNFIQELVTAKGSSVFDREYGTTFIDDLGNQTNIYKVDYILKNNIEEMKKKYGLLSVVAKDSSFDETNGVLNVVITLEFTDVALDANFDFLYQGVFTDKTIVEMN